MKSYRHLASILWIAALAVLAFPASALAQQTGEKKMDPAERAEKITEKLEEALGLEDWQCFYVDSILVHDYTEMEAEIESLKSAKVSNSSLYYAVQDKWMEQIDNSYKKIFTEKQWKEYMKTGAGKRAKERERRREKIEKDTQATRK